MNGLLIALLVIIAYLLIIFYLNKKKILAKYSIRLWGPLLMWRTQRGKKFIEKVSKPHRFWHGYAVACKIICLATMIFMMALLIYEADLVFAGKIASDQAASPQMILGIPGINPLIPIWYGILGLLIAVVVHEFAHGILTRVNGMKINALGVLAFVVPIGAFVEPDEEQLTTTTKKNRTDVYSVGPGTNMFVAIICALILFMLLSSALAPIREGPVVTSIYSGSPADIAGIQTGAQIVAINGVPVSSDGYTNFTGAENIAPGHNVSVQYYYYNTQYTASVTSGVVITGISTSLPAYSSGMRPGMIIYSINGTVIYSLQDLTNALNIMHAGSQYAFSALSYNSTTGTYSTRLNGNVTPADKHDYISSAAEGSAYLGVNIAYLGATTSSPEAILSSISDPYTGVNSFGGFLTDSLYYIALPFFGLEPLQGAMASIYHTTGIFAWADTGSLIILSNCIYWVFWISIMVGMTNALPAVPLDGGYLFKDWMDGIATKVNKKWTPEQRNQFVNNITIALALLVLFLIVWEIIGPRIM